jgi:hypothetical protein
MANDHWTKVATAFLYTHGGDTAVLTFSKGGPALAELLQQTYDQGRKDAGDVDAGSEVNWDRGMLGH